MKVLTEDVAGAHILRVHGALDADGAEVLRASTQDALRKGKTRIVIDLKGVSTANSSGIGELVSTFTTVTNRGGKVVLANLPPNLVDIFNITRLIDVFETFNKEEDAVVAAGSMKGA